VLDQYLRTFCLRDYYSADLDQYLRVRSVFTDFLSKGLLLAAKLD